MESKVLKYPSIVSTNSEAARLISVSSPPRSLFVVSDFQEHGRGQGANEWISDKGKNLLMSWIVFPAFLSVHLQFQLSKAVSLAISDLLSDYSIQGMIKWPNDIICNEMKVGGILIENTVMGKKLKNSIIGIGLNVNQQVFPKFPYRATSVGLLLKKDIELSELRDLLILKLEERYRQLEAGDSHVLDNHYLERLFRMNEESLFSIGERTFKGTIRGVSEMGELMVESMEGIACYGFHEIKIHY